MFRIHFSVERWRYNKEFEIYVSNKGHFRNREKKDLPIQIGKGGYCWVYCGGSVHKHMLAHRVVMLTWRPTSNAENLTIDHLDHNKRNNALDNLEWVTQEENLRRAQADLIIRVEGDPELVKKVDVSVVSDQSGPPTKYDFYLRLNKTVVLSVEQFANLFLKTLGASIICPNTKKKCVDENEFCIAIVHKLAAKTWKNKLYGYECDIVKKGE